MFQSHLDRSIAALDAVRAMENEVARAAYTMASCLHSGGRILSCGNGGSAAESAHFSTELLCRLDGDRPPLAAINLTADGSFLTATANDYQFDEEQEGIELVKRRVNQILALRARIKELAAVPRSHRTDVIADELSLSVFRLYEARFMIDKLVAKLRRLRKLRMGAMTASALPYDAPTAPKSQ